MRKNIDLESVEFASFPQRVAARLLDVIFVSFMFALFMSFAGLEVEQDAGLTGDLGLGLWIWFLPLLYLAYELPGTSSRGQTLGKRLMGILIVRTDGQTGIGFDRAIARFIAMMISVFIPFVGILALGWFVFDPARQNVPDKIARTFVIRVPKGFFAREISEQSDETTEL